jgi:hypothetical protein
VKKVWSFSLALNDCDQSIGRNCGLAEITYFGDFIGIKSDRPGIQNVDHVPGYINRQQHQNRFKDEKAAVQSQPSQAKHQAQAQQSQQFFRWAVKDSQILKGR